MLTASSALYDDEDRWSWTETSKELWVGIMEDVKSFSLSITICEKIDKFETNGEELVMGTKVMQFTRKMALKCKKCTHVRICFTEHLFLDVF